MSRIDYLDGWRGFAILSVLFGHFVTEWGLGLGPFGVELFFVLSGRLMAEILFVREADLTSFYVRRLSRIYPALLVFATAVLCLAKYGNSNVPIYGYLSALTLTYNYWQIYFEQVPFLDHLWSLCVEEHMYLLLGILAWLTRRFKFDPVPVMLVIGALFMANGIRLTLAGEEYIKVYWRSDVHGATILLAAAGYLLSQRPAFARFFTFKYGCLIAMVVALSLNTLNDIVRYSLVSLVLAYGINALPRDTSLLKTVARWPFISFVGTVSYSIYLWQQPFFKFGHHADEKLPLLIPALILGVISYYVIETPARHFINRLWGNRRPVRANDAQQLDPS